MGPPESSHAAPELSAPTLGQALPRFGEGAATGATPEGGRGQAIKGEAVGRPGSLRARLLAGMLLPLAAFVGLHSILLYNEALQAATTAYDRTLLASAKTIGEQLEAEGEGDDAQLKATVPFSALEAFEADNASRMYYRVSTMQGQLVSGFDELRFWQGRIAPNPPYAALVDFYDDVFRGQAVRVAVLLQPVASPQGRGMAVVQVAETQHLRHRMARELLTAMLWRHGLLMGLIAGVVGWVVQRATAPVRDLGRAIEARSPQDLSPIDAPDAPRELRPLIDATSAVMTRLHALLLHQKRFVRDSAHQLRTPLAVLKVQVQSAQRGDVPPEQALAEIAETVERATTLANQMLSLSKVEQLRQQPEFSVLDWARIVHQVALDLSPLVGERGLDFDLQAEPAPVLAHPWMLEELTRNLLHNAIRHSPQGAALLVTLKADPECVCLCVRDHGAGVDAALRERLFTPFVTGNTRQGSGLGLVIAREIVHALHGHMALDNRLDDSGRVLGLDAVVQLPRSAMPLS